MFDVPSESLLRRDIGSLFEVAPDRGQIETFLRRLKANRKESYGQVQEFVGRRRDGTTFPLEVSLSRSEEHTSELQSLMRISYAVFCLKTKKTTNTRNRAGKK